MSDSEHSATPLLLLPGLICDARIWAPQADALRAGRSVIAIEGYGEADSLGADAILDHFDGLVPLLEGWPG